MTTTLQQKLSEMEWSVPYFFEHHDNFEVVGTDTNPQSIADLGMRLDRVNSIVLYFTDNGKLRTQDGKEYSCVFEAIRDRSKHLYSIFLNDEDEDQS